MEYYNSFQHFEDYFSTVEAKGQNWVPFAGNFLKHTTLFYWHQYQRKVEDEADISITCEEFKAFFCQSLGKSKAFVDTIWRTI